MRNMFTNIVEKFELSQGEMDIFFRIWSIPYGLPYISHSGNHLTLISLEQKGLIIDMTSFDVYPDRAEYILSPTVVDIKCFYTIIIDPDKYDMFLLGRKKL